MSDFLPNFPYKIIIANAFYAKQTNSINYHELERYKIILYRTVTKKYPYVMFNEPKSCWPYPERVEDTRYEIEDMLFFKENDGVYLISNTELTREWINKVNYYYPDDIKEFFEESWQIYMDNNHKIKKKSR